MKRRLINCFKVGSGVLLAFILFFVSLVANTFATSNNIFANYKVGNFNYIYDSFINNDLEFANGNISGSVEDNTFTYSIFNVSNYKDSMSYVNDFVLTIPYSLNVLIPQSNNYEFNNYSVALYYFYTNDYSNITISNFNTFIESVSDSLNKETNVDNYYNDYINFTLDLNNNNTYLVFGFYNEINWDTSTTPTYSSVILNFAYEYSLLNVFNGVDETNESLSQENQQLKNDIDYKNNVINGLNDDILTLNGDLSLLTSRYNTLDISYRELQSLYSELSEGNYTFENLFWSVGSVPMAFLLQSFNVNVLGLNIARIITGLITALIIIWLIKRLLK